MNENNGRLYKTMCRHGLVINWNTSTIMVFSKYRGASRASEGDRVLRGKAE